MSDIVGAARIPVGSFLGSFASTPAHDLGAVAINAALARAGIAPEEVDEVVLGGGVSRLEARGYIKREISGSDRRSKVLMLTEMGERLLDALLEAVANAQVAMLQGLTDGERAIFLELLRKTIEAGNGTSRAPYRPVRD